MAKLKKRSVLGVNVISEDGVLWVWTLDNMTYNWCPAGQCRHAGKEGGCDKIILWSKDLTGAVAYTMGWHDSIHANRTQINTHCDGNGKSEPQTGN